MSTERAYNDSENDEWLNLQDDEPLWDWYGFEYRIKPQPTYRPYKNAEEFLVAQKEHGMYLREKTSHVIVMPLGVDDSEALLPQTSGQLATEVFLYENLLDCFVWQDGTPCGVEEE